MHFIAQELREILASLGLKRVEDLVGRTDLCNKMHKINNMMCFTSI
jgi:glutamate synthase (NADPH/NADH) large chain